MEETSQLFQHLVGLFHYHYFATLPSIHHLITNVSVHHRFDHLTLAIPLLNLLLLPHHDAFILTSFQIILFLFHHHLTFPSSFLRHLFMLPSSHSRIRSFPFPSTITSSLLHSSLPMSSRHYHLITSLR